MALNWKSTITLARRWSCKYTRTGLQPRGTRRREQAGRESSGPPSTQERGEDCKWRRSGDTTAQDRLDRTQLKVVLEGFFWLKFVTFSTLMADYEHFLRWVTSFNWFLWSIMPSGDGNTKFWTRHLRFSTRKLPLNMGYFEVFNYFFIFCISFLCFKIDLNHLELLYCTCSICGNLSPLYLCFHLWFKKEIIPYSSAICVALM